MRYIVDLHIHSKFSRACSRNLTLSNLAAWARIKGIDILGTSDFTHPAWRAEIGEKLEEAEQGLFRLKPQYQNEDGDSAYTPAPETKNKREVRFMLSTEVSCIYKKNGKTRRLHLLVFMPTIKAVDTFNSALTTLGCNIRADGRPILGLEAKEIVRIARDCDERAMVVPAHAWTPWFSVFGSESGFDSLEECFEEQTPYINAIETGLSSDPAMNHRLSKLDNITLISNSDAHGVRNLGREANTIDRKEISYDNICATLNGKNKNNFLYTIEFFPEEGKYHVDGHRVCDFYCEPEDTEKKYKGICPKCHKPLTRGVAGRVHALADRERKNIPTTMTPFKNIVPLEEVIGNVLGKTKSAKASQQVYFDALKKIGPEFTILIDAEIEEISSKTSQKLAEAIYKMRTGNIYIKPGYDGVYGVVKIFEPQATPTKKQIALEL